MPHTTAIRFVQLAALCFLGFGVQSLANAGGGTGRLTLDQVRSYEYTIAAGPNTQGINNIIAASPSDMILLGGGDPTAPVNRTVADPNHRKLIFGYIETTEASPYAEPSLFSNGIKSPLVGAPISGFSDLYSVQYWDPTWKAEVLRQVDQLIAAGYDGVFLDSLSQSDWTQGNSLGNPVYADAANALISLVAAIRDHVNSKQLAYPFYLIGNVVFQSDQVYLAVISNLDAVFNEWVYWGQPPSNGLTSVYMGTGNVQFLKTLGTTLLKDTLVFGNDYPNPLTNLDADFQSFALYSALGWIPSVTTAHQTEQIFSTGPFMFMAVPSNSTVVGTKNFVNFISGGKATAATLTGGDQGDYFIGGPGQNTITGGAGNDTVYAHPENIAARNLLVIGLNADVKNSASPTISVLINGQVALASVLVTATPGNIQEIKIDTTPFGTVSSIEFDGFVAPYVDQNHYANIQFQSVTYQNQSLAFNQAQYNSGSGTFNSGANAILMQGGKMTFSSPTLPIASPVFGNTSDTIDGGGGFNTVIYGGPYSNYTISPQSENSWLVTSASTAEGPDTLKNIQRLVFADQTVNLMSTFPILSNNRSDYSITKTSTGFAVTDRVGNGGTIPLTGATQIIFADMTVNLLIGDLSKTIDPATLKTLTELYVAFFNRIPDSDGLSYWITQFKAGSSINQIAESFYQAGIQYSSLTGFSAGMTNDDFINTVYRNVLDRPAGADADGLAYWRGKLLDGSATHGSLVTDILYSAHTYKGDPTWGWVADLLDNKYSVASFFCLQQGLNYNTPEISIAEDMAIAAAVTPTSTAAAIALIGVDDPGFNLTGP